MHRWTIQELAGVDDITFAMCILSEREAGLNPYAPLSQKLKRARHTLDGLRGSCPDVTAFPDSFRRQMPCQ